MEISRLNFGCTMQKITTGTTSATLSFSCQSEWLQNPDYSCYSLHLFFKFSILTKVLVGRHPANCFEGNYSQQARPHKGTNPREEKEEPHDGTLHGLRSSRVSELQTCGKDKCKVTLLLCKYTADSRVFMMTRFLCRCWHADAFSSEIRFSQH